jgi:hypothetical protein
MNDRVAKAEISAYLTGRINDFRRKVLTLVPHHLAKAILNRRIVALDEVTFHELNGERGFP